MGIKSGLDTLKTGGVLLFMERDNLGRTQQRRYGKEDNGMKGMYLLHGIYLCILIIILPPFRIQTLMNVQVFVFNMI